jgi:hypothetical protein
MKFHSALQNSQRKLELVVQARALRSVAEGRAVEPRIRAKLKKVGLIERLCDDWALTDQGKIALAFAAAKF